MAPIWVPVSAGELVDKLTILEIKRERINDERKRANVERELFLVEQVAREVLPDDATISDLRARIKAVNVRLWAIEDDLREKEAASDFGAAFLELARSVYATNHERSQLKQRISAHVGSEIVEEKEYRGEPSAAGGGAPSSPPANRY